VTGGTPPTLGDASISDGLITPPLSAKIVKARARSKKLREVIGELCGRVQDTL